MNSETELLYKVSFLDDIYPKIQYRQKGNVQMLNVNESILFPIR